jgi:hypothetical protein
MPSDLPDKPKPPTGRTLDRAALERVLARASELQAGTGDATEAMTEEQLIELGKEVGLPAEHVRQAIAEEQTRVAVAEPEGQGSGVFGPTTAWAQRVVSGTQTDVLARLDRYMQSEEALRVRRRFTERLTWEPRRDFLGNVKRTMGWGGRGYALTRANEVGATVVPVDAGRVLVRLDASFSDTRQRSVVGGGALAGAGVVSGGGLVTLAAMLPGWSMPLAVVFGGAFAAAGGVGLAAVAKSYRSSVVRAQLALEQALDRLEHGEPPRTSGGSLFDVLSSALNR